MAKKRGSKKEWLSRGRNEKELQARSAHKPARRASTNVQRNAVQETPWKPPKNKGKVLSLSEARGYTSALGCELRYTDGQYVLHIGSDTLSHPSLESVFNQLAVLAKEEVH